MPCEVVTVRQQQQVRLWTANWRTCSKTRSVFNASFCSEHCR